MVRRELRLGGRTLGYLEEAAAAPPPASTPTLVLLHAFPLAAAMWEPQLASAAAGWRVVAPDLEGFGSSSPGEGATPSVEDFARDALALLDHLGIERAVVAGLSMGGYAAFSLLRLAPQRVAGLVLADTRAEADGEAARAGRDAMIETLARGGAGAVFERMLPGLLGATTRSSRPAVVRAVRDLVVAQPAEGIRRAILRLKTRPDSTPLLGRITCPTLVLVGEEDQITDVEVARGLHNRIAGSALRVIGGAGHLSNLEAPQAFNGAIASFLSAHF